MDGQSRQLAGANVKAGSGIRQTRPEPVGRERRVVGQALSYWHDLRGSRPLPLLEEVAFESEPLLRGKMFLLAIEPDVDGCTFAYDGGALAEAFRCKTQGKRPHDVLPNDVADHLLDLVRAVVDFRRPLADAATLPRVRGGGTLMHRMVVMPVSGDGRLVTHVLGAFSYKVE